jgi:uncharacterized protein (UPF0210 family)
MLPILEDSRLGQRRSEGRISIDALLSYSAVCGTGLDTVPLPHDVTEQQLDHIIGDLASLERHAGTTRTSHRFAYYCPAATRLSPRFPVCV